VLRGGLNAHWPEPALLALAEDLAAAGAAGAAARRPRTTSGASL
jgi:hypothetical protein